MQAMREETNLAMHCHQVGPRQTAARNVVTGHTLDKVSWFGVAKWLHDAKIDERMGEGDGQGGGLIKVWRLEHEAGGDAGTNHHAAKSTGVENHGILVLRRKHIAITERRFSVSRDAAMVSSATTHPAIGKLAAQ
jgi:hypothetical protein